MSLRSLSLPKTVVAITISLAIASCSSVVPQENINEIQTPLPTKASSSKQRIVGIAFDWNTVKIADAFGAMTVKSIHRDGASDDNYFLGSIEFEGTVTVKGTYQDYRDMDSFTFTGVCIDLDEESVQRLPVGQGMGGSFFCFNPKNNNLTPFKIHSTGVAEVIISTLVRSKFGEDVDAAKLQSVISVQQDPENATECTQREGTWDATATRRVIVTLQGNTEELKGVCLSMREE